MKSLFDINHLKHILQIKFNRENFSVISVQKKKISVQKIQKRHVNEYIYSYLNQNLRTYFYKEKRPQMIFENQFVVVFTI